MVANFLDDILKFDMIYLLTAIGWHPVAAVQYTFTHKQYIEQRNRHKQYIEQHNSLIRKSADRATSLRGIPWHLPYNWGKKHGRTSVRVDGECQLARCFEMGGRKVSRSQMAAQIKASEKIGEQIFFYIIARTIGIHVPWIYKLLKTSCNKNCVG